MTSTRQPRRHLNTNGKPFYDEYPVLLAICLRVTVALLSVTFFQPDEYFQALEPAHELVFGYGHLTWEWRTQPPIRSIFFPTLFAPVYWILKLWNLDSSELLIIAPKLVQGVFASVTDLAIRRLARNVYGERYVSIAFFLSITSIFHVQALSRTLSNSLETSLTTVALGYWPFSSLASSQIRVTAPLIIAAVACMLRPTNAIIWVLLFLELSWRLRRDITRLAQIWLQACAVGATACVLLFLMDSWYFGFSTFTPLNFLRTNLTSVSTFYGRSPWHYYLFQAIPMLCNTSVVYVCQGIWKTLRAGTPPAQRLLSLVFWTVGVYSLAAHKEWRFIHPLLPVMHVLAAKAIHDEYIEKLSTSPSNWFSHAIGRRWRGLIIWTFMFVTPYLLFVQSRAQIAVMHHIRSIPDDFLKSVGFLMPCHSTPWQSYLHRPHLTAYSLWAIGCEPPLDGQDLSTYHDQSDIFYASPIDYLRSHFPSAIDPSFPPSPHPSSIPGIPEAENRRWNHTWPSHLVFFGSLLDSEGMQDLFQSLGYRQEWNGWNGWEQDKRRRGGVRVWKVSEL